MRQEDRIWERPVRNIVPDGPYLLCFFIMRYFTYISHTILVQEADLYRFRFAGGTMKLFCFSSDG